jgi:hypothetical protein
MPVVEKVKKPAIIEDVVPVAEDISIEKPRTRKPPTEAMKEAGRKNLEKGRLALQEKRKAAGNVGKVPTEQKTEVVAPVVAPVETLRPRSKKVIYKEESESEDEVVIIKKKKKAPKKIIYEEDSDDEPVVVRKKKTTPEVERPPSPPRHIQPTTVLRWI